MTEHAQFKVTKRGGRIQLPVQDIIFNEATPSELATLSLHPLWTFKMPGSGNGPSNFLQLAIV